MTASVFFSPWIIFSHPWQYMFLIYLFHFIRWNKYKNILFLQFLVHIQIHFPSNKFMTNNKINQKLFHPFSWQLVFNNFSTWSRQISPDVTLFVIFVILDHNYLQSFTLLKVLNMYRVDQKKLGSQKN